MKPAARIKCIKAISSKLAELEWSEIDLILRQFDFPWSGTHIEEGNRESNIIYLIESSPDDKLIELREFLLGGNDDNTDLTDLAGPWRAQRFHLFASHNHTDQESVSELKIALEAYGIDMFVAHEDIKPTREWEQEIVRALSTCDAVLAYLTPDFHNSLWTDQEIGYCISRRVLVVPLCRGDKPYGIMGKYQGLQGIGVDTSVVAMQIFELFIHHNLTSASMAAGLVGRIEDAENYDNANRLAGLLSKIESWTPELLRRLENARNANDQVAGGFTSRRVIEQILEVPRT